MSSPTRELTETLTRVTIGTRDLACASHDVGGDVTVIFCHGFRGEKTGPNRTFVRTARRLAARGVSSLRFDQYGSGDSDGEFVESRFSEWITAIRDLTSRQVEGGRRVVLFGQSMGASAAICAAAETPVDGVVAWVPDASIDSFAPDPSGFIEEGGQVVANEFWQDAHGAGIPTRLAEVTAPCYLVFGTDDEYVSQANRRALIDVAKAADRVDVFEGYPHSAWTAAQADDIIARSVDFVLDRAALR